MLYCKKRNDGLIGGLEKLIKPGDNVLLKVIVIAGFAPCQEIG